MSPLRRDELRVGLSHDRLVVARFERGLRRMLVDELVHPVNGNQVERLKELAQGCEVFVVLSSYLVRYQLLAWSAGLASEEEWLAFAQHRFASTYGDGAKAWEIRVSGAPKGRARVASAMDRCLLESLREIPGVVSVQPYLMAAFNAYRQALPSASWLVLHEPGRFTIGLIVDDAWKAVRTRQAPARWRESLPDLLEREASATGEQCDHLAMHSEDPIPSHVGRYRVIQLREHGAGRTQHVKAMALA